MNVNDKELLLSIKGIGKKRQSKITEQLHKRQEALADLFVMSPDVIKATFGIPINVAESIVEFGKQQPKDTKTATVRVAKQPPELTQDKGITAVHVDDEQYPNRLKNLLGEKAPNPLYVWGNLELFNRPAVGFCGSRNVSEKGLQVTADATEQLAHRDWVVVSGHARGVDATAHQTALEHNAGTIIVLPQGFDGFKLRMELRKVAKPENLLIVSEFPPEAKWAVGRAMQRNRTIIGLSDAMILIESRTSGGTFNAGKTALAYKQPLFVANFHEDSETNAGNRYFLQKGAFELLKSRETDKANLSRLYALVEGKRHTEVPREPVQRVLLPEEG